ncbi:MAG: hypothetical protein BWY99_02820 [Synergistetes bacterium ADurb.BinA166]|nr:MAG: hypothetical protein BWY99_02820 [Synergistetes bacterium ADurb.BinA166]
MSASISGSDDRCCEYLLNDSYSSEGSASINRAVPSRTKLRSL